MFRFRFPCTSEERVRATFEYMKLHDVPEKSIWGFNLMDKGIHFTKCDKRIKGFYIHSSEFGGGRGGSPIRTTFNGRFIKNGENLVFEVYICPKLIELMFIVLAYLSIAIGAGVDSFGFVFCTVIFTAFIYGYAVSIRECVRSLQNIVQ